jgi:hypothetical protein
VLIFCTTQNENSEGNPLIFCTNLVPCALRSSPKQKLLHMELKLCQSRESHHHDLGSNEMIRFSDFAKVQKVILSFALTTVQILLWGLC